MFHHLAAGLQNMLGEQVIQQQYKGALSEAGKESDQQGAKKVSSSKHPQYS